MNEICINKLISDFETGAQYLVLWLAPDNGYGYWYDLNSSSRKPAKFKPSNVLSVENSLRYEISDYQLPNRHSENSITETEKSHRDRLWSMMKATVESEPEIYERNTRAKILRMVAEEHNIKLSNLYPLLDRYWRSGKTKNAFIPAFHKRGSKGSVRNPKEKKIGRKPQSGGSDGKIITQADRANFAAAVKMHYLNRRKLAFTVVYEKLLSDFYSVQSENNPEQKKLLPPNERPSIHQFRYWYSKQRDTETEQKKRDGESAFELRGRAILGKSDFGLMGPGAQFQIDATVGDIYLVSQFDRSNLIGRPVLYFVIDAFSRMVTGMSVGLEGPSWIGMAGAIANMATDKVAYCKEYGIEITEAEWPCHHVPSVLRGDRGELISKNADNLVNMLGIRVENAPPYRADLKGIIEQHFRTINTNSVALLPGSVKPDMSKRGGHDYRLDAQLDIRRFTQIIIKCVLYYNNYHYMDYFECTEAMTRDNVAAIPVNLWNWGIRNCSGALRLFSEEQVRLAVMPADKATVTEKGIRFKGLFYSSDRAVRESWFAKARSKKKWKVAVSYDPRDMAVIYVWNDDDKAYDLCTLLDWNSKNAGKCIEEIIYEQHKGKIVAKQLKDTETEAKVNLNAEIDAIVAEAQSLSKGLPQKSKSERVSRIKENRRNEREAMQAVSALAEDAAETANIPAAPVVDDGMSPTLMKIKRKLEERLKNE
jgi:hypothetical protein